MLRLVHSLVIAFVIVVPVHGDEFDRRIESILLHQRDSGGWPKNYDKREAISDAKRERLISEKEKSDSTIDNGATCGELRLLAEGLGFTRANPATGTLQSAW